MEYRYNRRGQQTQVKDQNQTVHDYVFDALGRQTQDRVTAFGAGVDNAVKRIERTYEVRGMVAHTTSYDNAAVGLGNVLNDVLDEYDAWGLVVKESQSHSGPVSGSTPHVDYAHADAAHGLRPTSVTYPGGRQIDYLYDDDANPATENPNDAMNRLYAIKDDATGQILASYKYLGLGTIVVEDYESADVKLDLWGDTSGVYAGLDQFGRIVDQKWIDYNATPTVIDEYTYQYDLAGNRTSKVNTLQTGFNESYTYDDVSRLISTVRADSFDQSWTLDATGNFSTFNDDGTSQTRTTNEANQIQTISGTIVDPKYDAAGNMIFAPKSGNETVGVHFVRDAWNRQVAAYQDDGDGVYEPGAGDTLLAKYEFDGQNRRIEKTFADDMSVEYFYNQQWQMLEERFVDDEGVMTAANQYVWSPRYIDAPVVRFHDGNADGDCNPVTDTSDTVRYYTSDANFNVTTTITTTYSGVVTEHYAYTSYGEATKYDNNWSNGTSPAADGPLYSGYLFDAETGNYRVRWRELITSVSTFDMNDPSGYSAGDMNLYRYCDNNPLTATDSSGCTIDLSPFPSTDGFTKIDWRDFLGKPPTNSPYDAEIFRTDYTLILGKPTIECNRAKDPACRGGYGWYCSVRYENASVTVDIDRRRSWQTRRRRDGRDNPLMTHEQLHLYIWQVQAQGATASIRDYRGTALACSKSAATREALADAQQYAKDARAEAERIGDATNRKYDSEGEANHGINREKQKYWEESWWWLDEC